MSQTPSPAPARGGTGRRAAVATGRVLGTLLVAVALLLAYANRVVFDADAFADRAARSLRDPRVAGFVGERVADEVIAQKRDLTAFRPLLVTAARTVVGSEAFGAVFRQASRSAHEVAFSRGAEKVYLSLPDFGVLLRSTLDRLGPDVKARLPARLHPQLGDDVNAALGQGALRVLQLTGRLKRFTRRALGLGAFLLLLSVVLSPNRRRALLRTGVAIGAAAMVLFLLPSVLRAALTARVDREDLREAARGVFDAYTAGFRGWALALAGIGVVLAAVASSLASHVEVERAVQGAWTWLRRPSHRPAAELARALGLLGLGLCAAFAPLATLGLLTVLIGAALAFEGLRGLFALVAPHVEEAAERAEAAGARPWLRYGVVGVLAIGVVVGTIAYLSSPASLPAPSPLVTACNGGAALCDRRLDEVVLPGAHNAMAAADVPGWMFPNQERGIPAQLRHGVRALLIDVHNGVPVAGRVKTDLEDEAGARRKFAAAIGEEGVAAAMRIRDRLVGEPEGPRAPYLCHGFCEIGALPLTPVLGEIRDFLVEQPGEVLVIVIEDYVAPAQIARAFEESGLLRFVWRGKAGPPWPTLREMIAADQRVIVLAENETGDVPWYHRAFELMQETPYRFLKPDEFSCQPNRGGTAGSLFLINHWIDSTPTPKPSNAEIVNERAYLLARARHCRRERGRLPNILAVDFALTGDVVGAAAELNGL